MTNKEILAEISQRLQQAGRILVTSHINPDGDAVGSVLALGLALQEHGKQVQMVLTDGVPARFRFLTGSDQIKKRPKGEFDLVVVLDCGDMDRVGNLKKYIKTADINIDHHPSNPNFGEINLVETEAVSVTEMLAKYIPAFGLEITLPVAEALLTGLITDSQGFRTVNTRPEALRVAADLFELGADLPELTFKGLTSKTFESVSYWGAGLSKMERDGRLVWATLSNEDRQSSGYNGWDDADLVQLLYSIEDAEVAVIFIEQHENKVKVSWRSKPGVDVSKIAQQFDGGGHVPAAGATVHGSIQEVRERVIEATRKIL